MAVLFHFSSFFVFCLLSGAATRHGGHSDLHCGSTGCVKLVFYSYTELDRLGSGESEDYHKHPKDTGKRTRKPLKLMDRWDEDDSEEGASYTQNSRPTRQRSSARFADWHGDWS